MIRRIKAYFRHLNSRFRQADQIYMVLAALVIGLVGGLAAVVFRLLIGGVSYLGWRNSAYTVEYMASLPAWWKVVIPAAGGLVVGLITYRFAREARGHGVPEVMEAVALRGGRIRPRVVIAKMFASGISIGSGGSVGREGPIVQIGSALGSALGQWLRVDHSRLKTLVGCGAAAGIAGTFNAPVAGALFAVEIILGDFGVSQFSPIVISSVAATVVSHRFLGDFPAFQVPLYSLEHPLELFAYVGLGILAALVAIFFIRALYASEDLFDRLAFTQPLKPMIGGALIGLIGIGTPHIFGVGYDAITQALNGAITWQLLVTLVVFKIVAVSITIGSGGSGGVFAPSLFIGAMLGGAVGTAVHSIWPLSTGGAGAYALVGMGAVVAGGTHAPITAILIIFELTGDYEIILPLMISCIIATLLATRLQPASIYTLKLLRRGTDIHRGRAVNVLQPVPVREVMQTDVVTVSPGDRLVSLVAKFIHQPGGTIFVTEDGDRLEGIITADQITPIIQHAATLDPLLIAADIMASDVPIVGPDDSLADVMKVLGAHRGGIPVAEAGRLLGVIWPEDVIERYNTELFKRDMASSMVSAVTAGSPMGIYPAVGDSVVAEVPVPAAFVGKTIRSLDIRQRFGVSILMVKQRLERGREGLNASPDPEYQFQRDDLLLVLGPQDSVRALKRAGAT